MCKFAICFFFVTLFVTFFFLFITLFILCNFCFFSVCVLLAIKKKIIKKKTCKPGFTDDGENCTGSIFSGLSVLVCQQKRYHLSLVISSCYNFLLIAMQPQAWMQGRWIGRLARVAESRLTCFLEQFNWHFFRFMLYIVYSQEENKFLVL